jgi:L-serine deaminase
MTLRMILSVLVISLAVPAVALASRAPTASESAAIKAAVAAYIKNPSHHAASDNKVVKVLISTVDKRFASAKLTSVSGNSTTLLKKISGKWKVIGFSPSQSCSLASAAVRKDLGVVCGKG